MLPQKLAFVDIETTGCGIQNDRIIEIGVIRVEEGVVKQTFSSLLNPLCFLPKEIEYLTGITAQKLEDAPTFSSIKNDLKELLADCLFIAHNARFDYGFLKQAFKREEVTFSSRQLCTVKLSRQLFPHFKQHNLDAIIKRFDIACKKRHRAFDDAFVVWEFYQRIIKQFKPKLLENALNQTLHKPSLPVNLTHMILDDLPESPGVYIFYGKDQTPLYVGKSVNIRTRVLSHFTNALKSQSSMNLSQQVENIKSIKTAGEFGALFTESHLIKTLQPLFNKVLRNSHKLTVLKKKVQDTGYEAVELETVTVIKPKDLKQVIAVFKSVKKAKNYLLTIKEKYQLCEKLLGLEKTKTACFSYHLDKCKGACIGEENPLKYNMRFIEAISQQKIKPWPFKSAIVIEERNVLEQKVEKFLFDNWCFLGKWSNENIELEQSILFDHDIYNILNSYLRSFKNLKNIHQLTLNPKLLDQITTI